MGPELIHFVESPGFTKRIDKLASVDVLFSLQNDLVNDPELAAPEPERVELATKRQARAKAGVFGTSTFTSLSQVRST